MRGHALTVGVAGLVAGVVCLAGCSGKSPEQPAAGSSSAPVEAQPVAADTTQPSQANAAPSPAANGIPKSLQGRWGLVPADCTSDSGDAKGLLTVSPNRLTFYESVATLDEARTATDTMIDARFDFSGEGQSWTSELQLSSSDGRTMLRRDFGPDAAPTPLTYTRCP